MLEEKEISGSKRLVVILKTEMHCEIKKRAAGKNVSIRRWLEEAILEKIKQEKHLGFE